MKVFHILAPMPRMGNSNAFYRVGVARIKKTLCGDPVTKHDIRFSWEAFSSGDFEPCRECVEIRQRTPRGKHDA